MIHKLWLIFYSIVLKEQSRRNLCRWSIFHDFRCLETFKLITYVIKLMTCIHTTCYQSETYENYKYSRIKEKNINTWIGSRLVTKRLTMRLKCWMVSRRRQFGESENLDSQKVVTMSMSFWFKCDGWWRLSHSSSFYNCLITRRLTQYCLSFLLVLWLSWLVL
jgi:hypothetical protein